MQTTTSMKFLLASFMGCLTVGTLFADPVISDVVVRQRWPWDRRVDIDYVLACDSTQRVDIALTAFNSATALTCPAGSFSGDLYDVASGARRIVWDPAKTAYTNDILTQFRVSLTPTLTPAYMIIDLTKNLGEEGQVAYRYDWGPWPDVTANTEYKTSKLVLRRVPPGTFQMGSPDSDPYRFSSAEDYHTVTLTKGFYIGIFELTQAQSGYIVPNFNPSSFVDPTRPIENVSFFNIRGSVDGVLWPSEAVDWNCILGLLRTKTGMMFDLPTDAQWEYACRAGTTTSLNNGTDLITSPTDANLDLLARYNMTNGEGTVPVGSYLPNAWGIYDMHGNVWEWCVDWGTYGLGVDPVTDPVGILPATGDHVCHGSCWNEPAGRCRSAMRIPVPSAGAYNNLGFRVRVNLP